MPKPYPREFRDDVVRVARNRDSGVTLDQVAADFGIHPTTLTKWMSQARPERAATRSSGGGGNDAGESRAELRAAQRRIKLLEQENEVLRRAAAYLSQASLPGK